MMPYQSSPIQRPLSPSLGPWRYLSCNIQLSYDNIFELCHIAIFETCWTLSISLHRYLFKGLYWVWKFNLEIFFLNSHLTTSQKSKIHRSAPFPLNNGQDIHLVSCRIETLSRQPEYKVGRIKVGGGEDGPVSYANSCGHLCKEYHEWQHFKYIKTGGYQSSCSLSSLSSTPLFFADCPPQKW